MENKYCCACGDRRTNDHKLYCPDCVRWDWKIPQYMNEIEGPFNVKSLFDFWETNRPHHPLTK